MSHRLNASGLWLAIAAMSMSFAQQSCAAEPAGPVARGHQIAIDKCSRCHAVELGKRSPVADAPPFYTFAQMWPVEDIEEALAEGIMVGHEKYPMPVFVLEPNEIEDLVAYLKTIQQPAPK